MKTKVLGSLPTILPTMFSHCVGMNYKRKNSRKERNSKMFDYYYGFKKSFKRDYKDSLEFKKIKRELYLEK